MYLHAIFARSTWASTLGLSTSTSSSSSLCSLLPGVLLALPSRAPSSRTERRDSASVVSVMLVIKVMSIYIYI